MISLRSSVVFLLGLTIVWSAGCSKTETSQADPAAVPTSGAASIPGPVPGQAADPLHPVVLIETNLGAITVRLDAEKAPLTVDNFLGYVDSGFYNQTIIHQVFKGQGIMAGGYGVDLVEKPTRIPIRNEAHNGLKNRRGTLAMVRSADAVDSARSQFFFNLADNDALDHRDRTPEGYGYCVFGEVISGMEVLDKIAELPVHESPQLDSTPTQPVVIKQVRRSR